MSLQINHEPILHPGTCSKCGIYYLETYVLEKEHDLICTHPQSDRQNRDCQPGLSNDIV